jgi:hypothetical protein
MSHVNVDFSCGGGALMKVKCEARLHEPELLYRILADGYSLQPGR